MADLPIACTLSWRELFTGRRQLLPGIVARAESREPAGEGLRWRFHSAPDLLPAIASMMNAERRCCRFLRFQVETEPEEGAVWLTVTGQDGTKAFLERLTS